MNPATAKIIEAYLADHRAAMRAGAKMPAKKGKP